MECRLCCLKCIVLLSICFPNRASEAKARILRVEDGNAFTVNCSAPVQDAISMYLYHRMDKERDVLYYDKQSRKVTVGEAYKNRVTADGDLTELSVTITTVTDDDSGVYWCSYNIIRDKPIGWTKISSNSTLLVVNGQLLPCSSPDLHLSVVTPSLWMIATICAGSVLLLSLFILIICLGPRMKKACGNKKTYNAVYEDMRHPSLSRPKS